MAGYSRISWRLLVLTLVAALGACGDDLPMPGDNTTTTGKDSQSGLDGQLGDGAQGDTGPTTDAKPGDTKPSDAPDEQSTDLTDTGPDDTPVGTDTVEPVDSSDVADTADAAAQAKLVLTQPTAGAIVNPEATVQVRGAVENPPSDPLTYVITDETGAVIAAGDVTDTTKFGVDLPAPATPGTHTWTIVVQHKDTKEQVATATVVFAVNSLPTTPQMSIQPAGATAKDGLQAAIDVPSTDADGQTITYSYVWSKDGQPSGDTGTSLPVGKAKKGENWSVTVVASDGIGQSGAATASLVIGNSPPDPAALAPMATEVGLDGSLSATETGAATDIDGDQLTNSWVWTVGGETVVGVVGPTATVAELAAALGKPIAAGTVITVAEQTSDGSASVLSKPVSVSVAGGTACSLQAPQPHVVCTENGTTKPTFSCDSASFGNGILCIVATGLPSDSTPVIASTASAVVSLSTATTSSDGPFDVAVYDDSGKLIGSATWSTLGDAQSLEAKPADAGLNHLTVIVKQNDKIVGSFAADIYVNTPPTAPEVAISPNPAQAGEVLKAAITTPSQDSDTSLAQPITYSYVWTVDGQPTSFVGDTLPAGTTKKGEKWQVTVTPSDGVENGPSATTFLTIGNTPPKAPVLTVEPSEVGLLGTVKVTLVDPQTVDADGDTVTTTLVWKVDGVVVQGITGTSASVLDLQKAGANIQAGSVIAILATASDGGSEVSSAPATVPVTATDSICTSPLVPCAASGSCTDNGSFAPKCACAAPMVGDGVVCMGSQFPAMGLAGDSTSVVISLDLGAGTQGPLKAQLLDADGNVLASQAVSGKDATLQAKLLAGGQLWTVQVSDATGAVVAKASGSPYGDTPPSAPQVSLTPAQPTILTGVKVLDAKATDVDADQTLTYTYAWLKDGKDTGLTGTEVPAGTAKKGETWTLVVVANDGVTSGQAGQASIVIANAAPSAFEATLPAKVGLLGTATATVNPLATSDVDGDALTYSAVWKVDGEEVPNQTGLSLVLANVKLASGKVLKAGAAITCVVTASDGALKTSATTDICVIESSGADVCKSFNPCGKNAICINNDTLSPDCACAPGYQGDGFTCTDINECLTNNGGCDANATCTNVPGDATCACKNGYQGDGKTCTDINECTTNNGGCSANATCSNTPGAFSCSCNAGYTGNGTTCTDINECATNNGGCDTNAACSNSPGSFACTCKAGYQGDGKTCSDVDECAVGNGGCDANAVCSNSVGSFSCACKAGYSGNGKTCTDINECASNNGGCDLNAACNNTPGSFSCACKAGYAGDGKTCADVNECLTNNGGCSANAACTNLDGSFSCACKSGYSGDGKTCSDVNECASNNGGCSANATCSNSPGSFSCACNPGYSGDGKTCSDVNECATNNGGCDANAQCTNSVGSFSCACKAGYSGDGKTCTDVNECATNNGGCDANAKCTNSVGSFSCACSSGYSGDGKTCTDVNECATNNGGCSANAKCTNSVGSFACACNSGYTGNGVTCTDVNECATNNGGCSTLVTCTNTPGSFTCGACPSGYTGNGTTCTDVNECLTNNGGCDKLSTCTNTQGSFTCGACPSGYTGDGVTCADINECLVNNGGCDALTVCTNKPGTFTCGACPSGYTGTGATGCVDVNECSTNNGGCDALTVCTNKPGTFSCGACPSGYTGTGATGCVDVNECTTNNGGCDALTLCTNKPGTFTCGACPSGYTGTGATGCVDVNECTTNNGGCDALTVCTNKPGTFTCGACPSGYTGTGATGCVDVNECTTNNGGCAATATCTNKPGTFSCACNSGYTGDGKTCTDVNECLTNNGGCAATATCTNSVGSFSCACNTGYTGNGVTCTDVNECLTNNGGCSTNATCTNSVGSFSCTCKAGYSGNGVTCTDVNECLTNNGGCAATATCTNSVGSFSCACNTGYTGNGVTCTDVNECLTNNGGCAATATCTNSVGSFSCACNTGYSGNGVTCTDVNECLTNNGGCSANATCTNSVGSFSCACKTGYSGNGLTCKPSGCADGTREGFTNASQFPNIAACSGGFSVAGLLSTTVAKCALAGGNSGVNPNGTGCSAADLCETGWHICASSAQVAAKSSSGGCTGSTDTGAASMFFGTLQSGPGSAVCATTGSNDLFGCGNLGGVPDAGSCSPLNVFSNNLCGSLGAPWSCPSNNGGFDEAVNVTKSSALGGGVLCCRN